MIRFFRALHRALVRLYPPRFRRRWGPGMDEAFGVLLRRADRAGRWAVARMAAGSLVAAAAGAVRERWKGDPGPRGARTDHGRTGGREMWGNVMRDLRTGLRNLGRAPAFAVVAAGSIAIGIAATTAVFSVVDALLLRPMPGVENHERVVELGRTNRGGGFDSFTYPDFLDLRDEVPGIESAAAFSFEMASVALPEGGVRAVGMSVDPAYFDLLGVPPGQGRYLLPEEATGPGAHPVVVISDRFWRTRLGADPEVVGSTLRLNRTPYTVVGVAHPDFRGHMAAVPMEFWIPLMQAAELDDSEPRFTNRGATWHQAIALLEPGTEVKELNARLATFAEQLAARHDANPERSFRAVELGPVPGGGRSATRLFLGALLGMVGLVLLVTCTNVAGMFLARSTAREREMAVRRSLGAGRGRLIGQLTVETLLVFVLGGGLGVAMAVFGLGGVSLAGLPIPVELDLNLVPDPGVIAVATGVTLAAGLLFGVLPAIRPSAVAPATVLSREGRGGARESNRLRNLFAAAQVGFSVVLLVTAGLFARSLQQAAEIDPGFEAEGRWIAYLDLAMEGYDEPAARIAQDELLDRLRAEPWVRSAALATDLPLDLSRNSTSVRPEGWSDAPEAPRLSTDLNMASPGYLETLGIELVRGRDFTRGDGPDDPRVALVSETFAAEAWPGEEAVGRTFGLPRRDGEAVVEESWRVIGVIGDVKNALITETPEPMVLYPLAQYWTSSTQVIVETRPGAGAAGDRLRGALLDFDPSMSTGGLSTLGGYTSIGILPQRFAAALAAGLAALALLLSALGIYGVVAHAVALRRRDIGIRMALGAERHRVVGGFLRSGVRLALPGIVIGGAAAFGVASLLRSLLLEVSPFDPITFVGVAVLLLGVVLLASWIPARRAAGVDPAEALRSE